MTQRAIVPIGRSTGNLLSRAVSQIPIVTDATSLAQAIVSESNVNYAQIQDDILISALANPSQFIERRNAYLRALAVYTSRFASGAIAGMSAASNSVFTQVDAIDMRATPIIGDLQGVGVASGQNIPLNITIPGPVTLELARKLATEIYGEVLKALDPFWESLQEKVLTKMVNR